MFLRDDEPDEVLAIPKTVSAVTLAARGLGQCTGHVCEPWLVVQVPWKMYSSKAAAAQSFAMRRLRLNLPGAGSQLWCLSFRQAPSMARVAISLAEARM